MTKEKELTPEQIALVIQRRKEQRKIVNARYFQAHKAELMKKQAKHNKKYQEKLKAEMKEFREYKKQKQLIAT